MITTITDIVSAVRSKERF